MDREGKPPATRHAWRCCVGASKDLPTLGLLRAGSTALTACATPATMPLKGSAGDQKSDPISLPGLRIPMGLIRMCINDIASARKERKEMSEGLDPSCTLPAYVCGRLMAEFENLQRASSESEVNSSVLDRYFALASTYPAVAFPKIEILAQKHLRKLRRDKANAAYAIDARLQELHNLLQPSEAGPFPAKLGLEGQGLFALGYYHQKAWSVAQAQDRKQSNESAKNLNESPIRRTNR